MQPMSTKTIVVWVVAIIIVLIGGYVIYTNTSSGAGGTSPTAQDQAAATTTPQVPGQDVKVGTGAIAEPGMIVSVLFDSSAAHDNQPLVFTLGDQGLIPGFQIGINGMRVGGERQMLIPPSLAYGDQDVKDPSGKVIIPANSTLLFDVQLVDVQAGSAEPDAN